VPREGVARFRCGRVVGRRARPSGNWRRRVGMAFAGVGVMSGDGEVVEVGGSRVQWTPGGIWTGEGV